MSMYIESVGCCAPGLEGWAQSQPVLRGERAYVPTQMPSHPPQRLPANERRRSPLAVRLAFAVAEDALSASTLQPDDLATVFASSDGDTHIVHRLCLALAQPQRVVSPTDFHNSVHNSAAGYWSIAAGAKLTSTSLSARHASFAAGLLEAGALVQAENRDCLLVAFDVRPPETLLAGCGIDQTAAFALILTPRRHPGSLAALHVQTLARVAETRLEEPALEELRRSNPAARALPLLVHLARRESATVLLDGAGGHGLQLELQAP